MRGPALGPLWATVARETCGRRRIRPIAAHFTDPWSAHGLENLPATGVFTLALNHLRPAGQRQATTRLLASVYAAVNTVRADLAESWVVVVGYRPRPGPRARALAWAWGRWAEHTVRLPMQGPTAAATLRQWRQSARQYPVAVFPEGRSGPTFGQVRPGSGRWLLREGATIPVGVWYGDGRWQIAFGPAVRPAADPRLHDLQLGLAIARLLPSAVAPCWQPLLARWQALHGGARSQEPGASQAEMAMR